MTSYDSTAIAAIKAEMFGAKPPAAPVSMEVVRAATAHVGDINPPAPDVTSNEEDLGSARVLRIVASGATPDRVVYYFHGGGYAAGRAIDQLGMLGELSRAAKAHVLSLDYSLAPEAPFPAAYDEALQGLEILLRGESRVALGGDSAGGGLALAMMRAAAERNATNVVGAALLSPWADLTLGAHSIDDMHGRDPVVKREGLKNYVRMYVGDGNAGDPRISPLLASLGGLAPMLIQVGSDEGLLDDALRIDAAVRSTGGSSTLEVWPEMIHVWHRFIVRLPQAKAALKRAGAFLDARFAA